MCKTIALSGAEIKVEYGGGANAWLRNDGAAVIYAAKSAGVAANADGVVSIPAGGSAPVYGADGTVYLLGAGSVQLIGSDYSTNPFNGVSRGGAADIPTGAAGMVALDGLQGGVPFSKLQISNRNLLGKPSAACISGNSVTGFNVISKECGRSFVCKLLPNTTYTLKKYDKGDRFRIVFFNEEPTNTLDKAAIQPTVVSPTYTFTTGSDHLWMAYTSHAGDSGTDAVEPVAQLEYGSIATDYTPPIIEQEVTLRACGKNLIPQIYKSTSTNGVDFTVNDDGSVSASGTATADTYFTLDARDYMLYKKGAVMSLSGCPKGGGVNAFNLYYSLRNINNVSVGGHGDNGDGVTFTMSTRPDVTAIGITIKVCKNVSINDTFYPQLEIGSCITAYEPYHGSEVKITPDAVPYIVPNDIRQQDGVNNIMVSAGTVQVTGVRRDAALKKVWDKLDELTAAIIVSNGD